MHDNFVRIMTDNPGIWHRIPISHVGRHVVRPAKIVAYLALTLDARNEGTARLWFAPIDVDGPEVIRAVAQRLAESQVPERYVQTGDLLMEGDADGQMALPSPGSALAITIAAAQAIVGADAPCTLFVQMRDAEGTHSYEFWHPKGVSTMALFECIQRLTVQAFL